jgi:transcriptional regulator with XRE-family HTH domain
LILRRRSWPDPHTIDDPLYFKRGSGTSHGGTLLHRARKRAGLSQVNLADRAGVTQSVISAYESGQRQPSLPALARLIDAAGFELTLGLRSRQGRLRRL